MLKNFVDRDNLYVVILAPFTLEICAAAKNCKKTVKPYILGV